MLQYLEIELKRTKAKTTVSLVKEIMEKYSKFLINRTLSSVKNNVSFDLGKDPKKLTEKEKKELHKAIMNFMESE
jgi:hypothetical protein